MGVVLWEGPAAGSGEVRRSLPHALGSKGVLGTRGRVEVGGLPLSTRSSPTTDYAHGGKRSFS